MLEDICQILSRFIFLPKGADLAVALWVLHTYTFETAENSPILVLSSPDKRCGKTVTLEILNGLVLKPLSTSNVTSAALFRTVEKYQPTLLIDEGDTFIRRSDELRGILNSGHRKAVAYVIRTVGDDYEPRQFSTWCPKAIALIDRLPDTVEDRSVVIPMTRKSHIGVCFFEANGSRLEKRAKTGFFQAGS